MISGKNQNSVNYWIAEWVFICAECSVDIFAMMSGYFGINKKKVTIYRTVELIVIAIFYSIIITLGFAVFSPGKFTGIKDFLKGIFPPLVGRYWYITCFIPVLIFQPFINKVLLFLTEKEHFALLLLEVLVFSCVPSVIPVDFFKVNNGYSFVWLLLLYTIGAYLSRTKTKPYYQYLKKYGIYVFIILSFVLLVGNIFIFKIIGYNIRYMVAYTSPVVLTMGLCVLIPLSDIKLNVGGKSFESLSTTTFDVYLIHGHVLIYDWVLTGAFVWIKTLPWYFVPEVCVICAVSIFVICSFFGGIRVQVFRILGVKNFIAKISFKIDQLLYQW